MGVRFITDNDRTLHQHLKAYWPLDETGGLRRDLVGANHLTDKNSVTQAAGKDGATALRKSAQFTAANSEYLIVQSSTTLVTGDIDFSLAAWVYLDSKTAERTIIAKRDSSTTIEYQLFYDNVADRFKLTVSTNGTTTTTVTANTFGSPLAATWYFVVAWHDATVNTINISINDGTADSAAHTTGVFSGAAITRVGARDTTATAFWDGRIQLTGFWKKVLSATERTDLYNSGNGNRLKATTFAPDLVKNLGTGLISWWKLDESSGTRLDFAGGNNLTDNNTVTQAVGKNERGKSAQFTAATSEYLSIADNADLSTGDIDFTIIAWVKADTLAAERYIFSKEDSATVREYSLRFNNTANRFTFEIFNSAGTSVGAVNADALGIPATGTWYFIMCWHDLVANTVSIQVNNGTVNSSAETGVLSDTAAGFKVGARNIVAADFWNGRIDDVGFWKRVLTAQERADLYNAGKGTTAGSRFLKDTTVTLENDLISYWKLEEDSSSRADYIGGNLLVDNNTVTRVESPLLKGSSGQFTAANLEYLSIGDNSDLSTGDIDFTVAGWVYLDSKSASRGIASKGTLSGVTNEWNLYYNSVADRFTFEISSDGSTVATSVKADALGPPATTTLYLIVAWHDSVSNTVNIQVNNLGIDQTTTGGSAPTDRAGAFEVGRVNAATYMDGRIDEVGFWKRVLTADERTALYNA